MINVLVLNTGRCGSKTFYKACKHITNFSCGYESLSIGKLGDARFNYPSNHIEIDNRLSWFLGRLDIVYDQDAIYVHLKRNREDVANSFVKRFGGGIIDAYCHGMLRTPSSDFQELLLPCLDYYDTVNANIELFLKDKPEENVMVFNLEKADKDFRKFWNLIKAEGNLKTSLQEFVDYARS